MERFAAGSEAERADLFAEAAVKVGLAPAMVEKDFWVCWILKRLFTDAEIGSRFVFKGGTSLSKVFGLTDRFSEDVDLILDWRLIGLGQGGDDPYEDFKSNTQQDKFNKGINERATSYMKASMLPAIRRALHGVDQIDVSIHAESPDSIHVAFPATYSDEYVRSEVCLEIGPVASWTPSSRRMIRSYAAEAFPEAFDEALCEVLTLDAERTFWEKATILHQQAHRTGSMPSRYSRHYYDIYRLATSSVKGKALANLDLLADVGAFTRRFYPSPWAKFENAKPGSFRVLPRDEHAAELRRDYAAMKSMFFSEPPAFEDVLNGLAELEAEINGLAKRS